MFIQIPVIQLVWGILDQKQADRNIIVEDSIKVPWPFKSADELLRLCKENSLSISEIMLENEKSWCAEE